MHIDVRSGGVTEKFAFEGEQELDLSPDYTVPQPAKVNGSCIGTGEGIYVVNGNMEFDVEGPCALCSQPANQHVSLAFEERFEREPDDEEIYAYDGEMLDLAQALQDNAVLNMPGRIVCKPDCKGLCPVCGQDLNEGTCGCQSNAASPFDILRQLDLPEEEE